MKQVPMIALVAALSLGTTVGCASKKYVRSQTGPTINKVNELDEITARNSKDLRDVDARAQQGIQGVNAKTAEVDQKAMAASQSAQTAQQVADAATHRINSLANTVANLDNYRPVAETTVHFGFDKAALTAKAKEALDQLGNEITGAKNYIVVINGNTDSVGAADYNYQLSQRRADSVVQYMASKYSVPAHKIFLIGLGEDKPAAENNDSKGRAENRRVDIRLMTNIQEGNAQTSSLVAPAVPQ